MTEADARLAEARPSVAARALMALITGYRRFIGPLLAPRCRFAPSCRAYALEAVREHGALRGAGLAGRGIGRRHPVNPRGVVPVAPPPPRPPTPPRRSSP